MCAARLGSILLKFRLQYHALEDLDQIGSLQTLKIFAFERFNIRSKLVYWEMLQRQSSELEETVRVLDAPRKEIWESLVVSRKEKRQCTVENRERSYRNGPFLA